METNQGSHCVVVLVVVLVVILVFVVVIVEYLFHDGIT